MKLSEAYPICKTAVNQPFINLFNDFSKEEIILNKGKVGQLMEKYCGLKLSNTNKDFEDGELKTSEIKESTQITMITHWIDEIIHGNPLEFEETLLFKKIENMIFMPLVKPSEDPLTWYFESCIYIPVKKGSYLYSQIKDDYEKICTLAHQQVYKKNASSYPDMKIGRKVATKDYIGDGFLHTTSGKFIQIRTKDAGGIKSKPIFSGYLNRNVTKVSRMAFYFLASFKKYTEKLEKKPSAEYES
jgi:DNA mismatch repair protein MutH